jgi:hypothetical protein
MLTGVRDELLDRIPAERTRYTALAAVMICTASVGGFSMFFALSEILGKAEVWFVFLAVFWATFILCIDCWLVSSTAGSRWRTRISVLLPRLAIAAVFGVVIAEPLVLRVFQTGIVSHVRHERQAAIDNLRTSLVDCNPIPGITGTPHPPPGGCGGKILNIANPAAASLTHLMALQRQEFTLQAQVSTETSQLTRLQNIVNSECNGNSGRGLTGVVGDGPACGKDQQDVNNFIASHPIGAQSTQLSRLDPQIRSLEGGLSEQQASYRTAIAKAIVQRLKQETPPADPIGMAERFQALTALSASNAFIGVASWFVRVFFILIDCLPVLVKFISGSTPYDRLVDIEISSAEKRFGREKDTNDAIADEKNITDLRKAKAEAAQQRRGIDLEILRQNSERETDKEDAVDELWRRKLRARRSTGAAGGQAATGLDGSARPPWDEYGQTVPHVNGSSDHLDTGAEGAFE